MKQNVHDMKDTNEKADAPVLLIEMMKLLATSQQALLLLTLGGVDEDWSA